MSPQTIINVLLAFVTSSPFPDSTVQSTLNNAINTFVEMQVEHYKVCQNWPAPWRGVFVSLIQYKKKNKKKEKKKNLSPSFFFLVTQEAAVNLFKIGQEWECMKHVPSPSL